MKFWNRLSPVGRALVLVAIVLSLAFAQAPELAFLLDSIYIDLAIAIIASGTTTYLAYANNALARLRAAVGNPHDLLLRSLVDYPSPRTTTFLFSVCIAFLALAIVPAALSGW
ncbi:MAG: hypothetical protein ABI365_03455, partial [Lysobacteraceae bacterium]